MKEVFRDSLKRDFLLCLLLVSSSAGAACKNSRNFDYLKKNFSTFYAKEYDCFFDAFNRMSELVKGQGKERDVSNFLSLISEVKGNAEVLEAYSETVEYLAVNRTELFLKAVHKIKNLERAQVASILKAPNATEKGEIQQALSRFASVPKYREFMELSK